MAKKKGAPSLIESIRTALQEAQQSGQTLNKLGAACGVGRDRLSRFARGVPGRGISLDAADRLCRVLGLHLVQREQPPGPAAEEAPKRRRRPKTK
jgi:hypothetical protein